MKPYILDCNYSNCPICSKTRFQHFVYKDEDEIAESSSIIGQKVGICDNCLYCLYPEEFEAERRQLLIKYSDDKFCRYLKKIGEKKVDRTSPDFYISQIFALGNNESNSLFIFLKKAEYPDGKRKSFFSEEQIRLAFRKYCVQTSILPFRKNAAIFWYKPNGYQTLAYRIAQFDEYGHLIKDRDREYPITKSIDVLREHKYCFFGRHLIKNEATRGKTICIVESEKTAIIASMVYPDAIWLATSSSWYLNSYNVDFNTSNVVLFPDLDVHDVNDEDYNLKHDWYLLINEGWLQGARISGFIEKYVKEHNKPHSYDIADYILENYNINQNNIAPFSEIIR